MALTCYSPGPCSGGPHLAWPWPNRRPSPWLWGSTDRRWGPDSGHLQRGLTLALTLTITLAYLPNLNTLGTRFGGEVRVRVWAGVRVRAGVRVFIDE